MSKTLRDLRGHAAALYAPDKINDQLRLARKAFGHQGEMSDLDLLSLSLSQQARLAKGRLAQINSAFKREGQLRGEIRVLLDRLSRAETAIKSSENKETV